MFFIFVKECLGPRVFSMGGEYSQELKKHMSQLLGERPIDIIAPGRGVVLLSPHLSLLVLCLLDLFISGRRVLLCRFCQHDTGHIAYAFRTAMSL